MSIATGAYVSLKQIVASWRLKRGKSIHVQYKIIKLAADAVQDLSLSSLPMIQHTLLYKASNESWFRLPPGYTDYVSVGIRVGDRWRPIPVSERIMPYPNSNRDGQFNSEYADQFNKTGDWTNWLNPVYKGSLGDFAGDDFFNNDFNDNGSSPTPNPACCNNNSWAYPFAYGGWGLPWGWSSIFNDYGEPKGRYFGLGDGVRSDVCAFNTALGIIMVPNCFPCNELYLSYVSIGKVDSMTHIPIQAQRAIEAYISWKYEENKRNRSGGECRRLEDQFDLEHARMRATFNNMSPTEMHRILCAHYGRTQPVG